MEVRPKPTASATAPSNPSSDLSNKSAKHREEGELSSSEDDGLPSSSPAPSVGATVPPVEPILVAPSNKNTQGTKAGKSVSVNNAATSIDIQARTSIQPNYHKGFEKNRVPFKSGSSGWYGPPGSNNNLVISFSDNDSGSDSEEYGQEKASTLETKGDTVRVDGNKRTPASSVRKSEMLERTTGTETKMVPKKVPLSRRFIQSTKAKGFNSRNTGPLLIEQGSRVGNFSALNKNLAKRDREVTQGVFLNNSKLQDLRQQIALRESELKLKSAQQNKEIVSQQNKETVSGSCKDNNSMNLNNSTTGKSRSTSIDIQQLEPKEPDGKRLKVSGTYSRQINSNLDDRHDVPAAKSLLGLKEPASQSSGLLDRDKIDRSYCEKEVPANRTQSSIVKWKKQDEKGPAVSLENLRKNGADNIGDSQSDRNARQVDPLVVLNQTVPLANMASNASPKRSNVAGFNCPSRVDAHHPPNKMTCQHNLMRSNGYGEAISNNKKLESRSNSICQTSLNNANLWNCLNDINISGHNNMDIQSLVEIEELQDKELEDAQEQRRKCEIEERNALKAYRKAQRALIEANARCTYLYRKREMFSAQFRSLTMEDSSLFWTSRQHEHAAIGLNSSNNMSEFDLAQIPMSSNLIQTKFDGFNNPGYDSNIQSVDGVPFTKPYQHVDGQNLGSEPCSEPDASTSELLPRKGSSAANRLCSPSNDPNISADEDEDAFPFEHESVQPNAESWRKEAVSEEREKEINELNTKFATDSPEDSLLLEATLRSELFARLGVRTLSKNSGHDYDIEPAVDREVEDNVGRDKTQMRMRNIPFSDAEKTQQLDLGGAGRPETSISEIPVEIDHQCYEKFSGNNEFQPTDDPKDKFSKREVHQSTTSVTFSPPFVLRSAFGHMKVTSLISSLGLHTRDQQNGIDNAYNEEDVSVRSNKILPSVWTASSTLDTVRDGFGEAGSYTCNLAVDPFWPLCMYELRGKCNNEECVWQHVKDYTNNNMNQHDESDNADWHLGLSSHQGKFEAWCISQCGQKCFSTILAVSSLVQKDFPVDQPLYHGSDGRLEVHGSWNRQSLYIRTRNGVVNQIKQGLADSVQSLEMALLVLNQEVNKVEGMKKALSVLSRALEADPTSVALWIVYLLIYYSSQKTIGKDDMFIYAIKHTEGSYELWLMFINSRAQLDERLVAYDTALSALCRHASASDGDAKHASACILDLFLQMMGCLCMSRNIRKAIQRIYGLLPSATNSDEPHSLSLSDILTCLTITDKCIFWVCCVYLVIYRKLPDDIVQRFECEKEFFAISWPSVCLRADEKQQALKLMGTAVNSVESYFDNESLQSETTLRSAQLFALNHVRCVVAVESLECGRNLLDKYTKLYPSCLELVLISAQTQKHDFGGLNFGGFEDALSNWPKESPGIQCIWSQYAEYALRNGSFDVAKEIMSRWYNSVWKVQCPQNDSLSGTDGDNSCCSLESALASNLDISVLGSNKMDAMFGLLNLSLYRLFQNDLTEARMIIDKSLKTAAPEYFKHCVREHAMFMLTDGSELKEDASINGMLKILKGYLSVSQNFPVSEPLSRKFIQTIKKPRVQQLVSNMLSPMSSDFSLLNLVLEVWHGQSLLPQESSKLKDLVDFVEAIMEISPCNYQLAMSACKQLLSRGHSSGDASASVLFWGSSLLINAISQAIPVAPEFIWVEAAGILDNLMDNQVLSLNFHKRALSLYPFSIRLWKSYLMLSKITGNMDSVVAAAKEKGIELD
ncbi:uncharacterized protein LOC117928737 [Vitis riparia]|uniref:uncharacterized protein LOC117928737 n=1 Tax=Vitis riparia TaxID=96939 RepID=UPI00155B3360|nr:uncharacterized protein LOC117928737 [Vitis riparia]